MILDEPARSPTESADQDEPPTGRSGPPPAGTAGAASAHGDAEQPSLIGPPAWWSTPQSSSSAPSDRPRRGHLVGRLALAVALTAVVLTVVVVTLVAFQFWITMIRTR